MEKKLETQIEEFHAGTCERAYEIFGARKFEQDGKKGYLFRTWAPNAKAVYICGDFNQWSEEDPMKRVTEGGIWEAFVPRLKQYDLYKFQIEGPDGKKKMKADPYGFHMELRPGTASKLFDISTYKWKDKKWKEERPYDRPMNIYEVHLGSWRRNEDGSFYSYQKMAEELIPYIKEMGYTHVELLPINEYPYDGSWGYQILGYFAPTSRFGKPTDFMEFVDLFHQNGIGVIMDYVPGHFPKDGAGLYRFDGGPCYEYADPLKSEHKEWGTMIFDWGRSEVRSFLLSNAMYWLEHYHIDGLRVDAVASMLYLDYNRRDKEWRPNKNGGRENLEAVDFLQRLNKAVFAKHENVLMIAEESTAWPLVTMPVDKGGLGFNFKWNMGWMNDTLEYMKTDSLFRTGSHNAMTFSLTYAFAENYILPLSHDEVVHMKGSLINKMPGEPQDQFANLRTYLAYMMGHPGKKLFFMGGEFAQLNEWHYESQLDWELLKDERHKKFKNYVKELNHFYLQSKELWDNDSDWQCFQWIEADDGNRNTYSFRRYAKDGSELILVCNFAACAWKKYKLGMKVPGTYKVVLNTGSKKFGGEGGSVRAMKTKNIPWNGCEYSIEVDLPPLTALFIKRQA